MQAAPGQIISWFRRHRGAAVVLLTAIIFQSLFFVHSAPVVYPDSRYYLQLSDDILRWDWSNFTLRTPGYPMFLAIVQLFAGRGNLQAVITVHYLLGCAVPLLIYFTVRQIIRQHWIAAAVAILTFPDLQNVAMQQLVLTEPLSQFLILTFIVCWIAAWKRQSYRMAAVAGVLAFLLLLVRPSFQLVHWAVTITAIAWDRGLLGTTRRSLRWYLVTPVVAQALTILWSTKIYLQTGHFTISLLSGVVLMSHAGPHVAEAPGEHEPFKSEYVRAVKDGSGYAFAVFPATERLAQAHGYTQEEIALGFGRLSKWTILHNMPDYIVSFMRSVTTLLVEPVTGYYGNSTLYNYIQTTAPWKQLYSFLDHQYWSRPTRIWASVAALILLGGLLIWKLREQPEASLTVLIILTVFSYNVVIHSAVNTADLGRYRLPLQGLFLAALPAFLFRSVELWLLRDRTSKQYRHPPPQTA